jgi:hypothetical protein
VVTWPLLVNFTVRLLAQTSYPSIQMVETRSGMR